MRRLLSSIGMGAVIALAVSVMAFSMVTMFRHEWLYAAQPIVCPEETTLELTNASPVPGELVLEASCVDEAGPQDVTGRFLVTVVGVVFLPTLLLSSLILWARG